jgi:hypothetical protein
MDIGVKHNIVDSLLNHMKLALQALHLSCKLTKPDAKRMNAICM